MKDHNSSLGKRLANVLREELEDGEKVIWREPFRWFDDNGLRSNHFECQSPAYMAAENGFELIYDAGDAAIIKEQP